MVGSLESGKKERDGRTRAHPSGRYHVDAAGDGMDGITGEVNVLISKTVP